MTRLAQQEALVRLSAAALHRPAGRPPFEEAVRLVADVLGVERVEVLELRSSTGELVRTAGVGDAGEAAGGAPGSTATGSYAGYTLDRDEPVTVADFGRETRFAVPGPLLEAGMVSGISAVIPAPDGPFGVVDAGTTTPRDFTKDEVSFIQGVAGVLGAALARPMGDAAPSQGDERFRAFLESAPDPVVVVNADGRIVLVNPQLERLFGYERDELVGSQVELLLPESLRGRHVSERNRYLADPTARPMGSGLDLEARRKEGTRFPVDVSLSPLPGDEPLVAAAVRDMTARVEHENERRRLHEARLLRRQSLEINDNVVQGLATASYALELGDAPMARAAIRQTMRSARRMMSTLLGSAGVSTAVDRRPDTALPVADHASTPVPEGAAGPESPLRVVIADDVPEIRKLLRTVLRASPGFDVVGEAADGQAAVQLAATLKPDALLLDLAMPVMDGFTAIPEIRHQSPDTKICVLSGYADRDMEARASDLGAHAYVEKGHATNDLTRVLRRLCLQPTG